MPAIEPVIEVFADVWCPFTHVGLKVVAEQLQARRRRDVPIWVRSWPLEWVNGRAMDPKSAADHARDLRDQVAPELFSGLDMAAFPRTTVPLLALVARAYKVGLDVGEGISFEVRDWLFERGRDVADPEVLAELATLFELGAASPDDYATVVSDWKEGKERSVLGSPHFYCGTASVFCPSLDIAKTPGASSKTVRKNLGRLGAFLDQCVGPGDGTDLVASSGRITSDASRERPSQS